MLERVTRFSPGLDGRTETVCDRVPIQVRSISRNAFEHSRYRRPTLLVNQRRSTHRAGKVEQMSRAPCPIGITHLSFMPSEHPFMLELASSPLTKLPCSPPRTIHVLGRLARKWWLHELSGRRQRRQHFGTLGTINWLRAVSVCSSSKLAEAPQPRLSCTAVQALLVAAHGPTCSG